MDVRARILAAAVRLCDREGVDAVSLRRVASMVGLTPMAVYRHVPGKDALVSELTLRALERWDARVARVRARSPRAWLLATGDAFLDFALEQPRAFEAAFLVPSRGARRFPRDFARGASRPVERIVAHVEACIAAGVFRRAPPLEVALAMWAQGQGLVSLYRAGRFEGDERAFRRVYRRSLRMLLRGLAA
jgi:AcrR family transcriptional regulator